MGISFYLNLFRWKKIKEGELAPYFSGTSSRLFSPRGWASSLGPGKTYASPVTRGDSVLRGKVEEPVLRLGREEEAIGKLTFLTRVDVGLAIYLLLLSFFYLFVIFLCFFIFIFFFILFFSIFILFAYL